MAIFSAAEAYASTKNTIANDTQDAISKTLEKINRAIQEGSYSVTISITSYTQTVRAELISQLRAAGYDVTDQGVTDQRDYGYYTISWLTPPGVTE